MKAASKRSTVAKSERAKLETTTALNVGEDVSDLVDVIYSILTLSRLKRHNEDMSMDGIIALTEKAGFLADRCCVQLGRPPMCGTWEEWARLESPKAEDATAAANGVGA